MTAATAPGDPRWQQRPRPLRQLLLERGDKHAAPLRLDGKGRVVPTEYEITGGSVSRAGANRATAGRRRSMLSAMRLSARRSVWRR